MVFAIDIKNRRDPSNEMCHQLQLKKTKVMLYIVAKGFSVKTCYY